MKKLWENSPILIILFVVTVICDSIMIFYEWKIAVIELIVAIVILILAIVRTSSAERSSYFLLKNISKQLDSTNKNALSDFPLPVMILNNKSEKILWYNEMFRKTVLSNQDIIGKEITDIIINFDLDVINPTAPLDIEFESRKYSVFSSNNKNEKSELSTLYFIDNTNLKNTVIDYRLSQPVVMIITIDSIDELLKKFRASEQSAITSGIQSILENWIASTRGFLEVSDSDRFFAVIEQRSLKKIIDDKFSILDKVRSFKYMNISGVTLSIGVGCGDNLRSSEEFARQALDMALGRGGDQAAVKDKTNYEFFGGVSKGIEKRTKVKTRIAASNISALILGSENVLVMGHRFSDLDAFGASVGIWKAATHLGKPTRIVMSRSKTLASPLLERMEEHGGAHMVIEPEQAFEFLTRKTLLIVVDTHRKSFVEAPELLEKCDNLVVIDHHRKTVDHIDNAVLFFHEPYASSTCEMVAELIQYLSDAPFIGKIEAEALLSGIMLDTRNFIMRTGVRTFEAAAFLKSCDADTVAVKQLFANSMDDYKLKTQIISTADIYRNCAVSVAEVETSEIRVVSSQAADELLNVSGVLSSFVIYKTGEITNISARSLGAMNVQLIMETLGGGGHQTMSAAQLENVALSDAKTRLLEAIDLFYFNNGK